MSIAPWKYFIAPALACCVALSYTVTALAQTDAPTRAENERHHFAFTFEANSLVVYPKDGDGFSCIHNPQGGGKGTQPDYRLLVYGSPKYVISADAAKAAKLNPPSEQTLSVDDVKTNTRWNDIFKAVMSVDGRTPAGEAIVSVANGPSLKVPYYIWSATIGAKTRYALMYVLIHGDSFITVQVESGRPLNKTQEAWFTSKLELLKIAPPEPAK